MPEDFTKDTFKMRQIQQYKITSAEERKQKILKLVAKFAMDETLSKWGINMNQAMADLKGMKLREPQVIDGNRTTAFSDYANRKIKHAQSLRLRNEEWAFCYQQRDG